MDKLAILIGIDDYPFLGDLDSSENDIGLISNALRAYWRFSNDEILTLSSSGRGRTRASIWTLEAAFKEATRRRKLANLVVAFRGRANPGWQTPRRLCFPDTDLGNERNVKATSLPLRDFFCKIAEIHAVNTTILLDYRPTLPPNAPLLFDAIENSLIQEDVDSADVLRDAIAPNAKAGVLYACSPGESPFDKDGNSLFAAAFSSGVRDSANAFSGSLDQLAGRIALEVGANAKKIGEKQLPLFKYYGIEDIRFSFTRRDPAKD